MNANTRTFAIALLTSVVATPTWAQELGRVHFQTSCTPQAQEKFDRGLALLHSFFYPDSVQAFTEAAAADPHCAIAYWGIAVRDISTEVSFPFLPFTILGTASTGDSCSVGTSLRVRISSALLLR